MELVPLLSWRRAAISAQSALSRSAPIREAMRTKTRSNSAGEDADRRRPRSASPATPQSARPRAILGSCADTPRADMRAAAQTAAPHAPASGSSSRSLAAYQERCQTTGHTPPPSVRLDQTTRESPEVPPSKSPSPQPARPDAACPQSSERSRMNFRRQSAES